MSQRQAAHPAVGRGADDAVVPTSRALRVLYGGTFDPVHLGHLAIAEAARDVLACDVWLVPAADPPHRAATGADAAHRARMLELAVAGKRGLRVDRRELARAAPSYTVDTLRDVRVEIGGAMPLAFLLGADSLRGLHTWREWKSLLDLAHLVVAERPGQSLETGMDPTLAAAFDGRWTDDPADLPQAPAGFICRLRQPLHPASATRVRAAIAADGPWRTLVPPAVAAYIDRHRLYATAGSASGSPLSDHGVHRP